MKMEEKPKIKLELTNLDKVTEIIGWVSVLVIWILTVVNFNKLPDIIPIHYNEIGEADGFGGKANILTLPIIATVLYLFLTILNYFPYAFNYPTNITKENAIKQYTIATKLVRYLKLILVLIFGFIVFKTIQNAKGQANGLGIWFLPILLAVVFIPIIYAIIKLTRKTKI